MWITILSPSKIQLMLRHNCDEEWPSESCYTQAQEEERCNHSSRFDLTCTDLLLWSRFLVCLISLENKLCRWFGSFSLKLTFACAINSQIDEFWCYKPNFHFNFLKSCCASTVNVSSTILNMINNYFEEYI